MPAQSPPTMRSLVRRARAIDRLLQVAFPDARCELNFHNPFELLVATVLLAQTTDVRVNQVTPALFAAYPTAQALAGAPEEDVATRIRPTGFFRVKAHNLVALSQVLCDKFAGEVPPSMTDLVTLPGVGRKTANVVLGNAFGIPGFPVDTHVGRLARRLGFTTEEDPVKVEAVLCRLIEPKHWTGASHRLIFLGRRVCHARRPACDVCPVARLCPSAGRVG